MDDLISRKAAIDAFWKLEAELRPSAVDAVLDMLKNLPSVQHDIPDKNVGDLISRQMAIDALDGKISVTGRANVETVRGYLNYVYDRIKRLPSAQPIQKSGKWLPDNRPGGGFWVCSCCKFPSEAFAADALYKFCPNCGADMRGERDE